MTTKQATPWMRRGFLELIRGWRAGLRHYPPGSAYQRDAVERIPRLICDYCRNVDTKTGGW